MGSGAKNRELKKERWFDAGAAAYERVYPGARARNFPDIENPYICPLCKDPFPRTAILDGSLTFEDAPPKSYGGNFVALTCKRCNNTMGTFLDGNLAAFDGSPVSPCKISIEGIEVNAYQEVGSAGRNYQVPDNQNNPELKKRFFESLDSKAEEFKVTLSEDPKKRRRAELAWLKSAYMVAFATWGYIYSLSAGLDIVRRQLRNIDDDIIPHFKVLNRGLPRGTRYLMYVRRPFEAVGVVMGPHIVFLPADARDMTLYSRIEPLLSVPQQIEIAGDGYFWPKAPTHFLDIVSFDSPLVLPTQADVHLLS